MFQIIYCFPPHVVFSNRVSLYFSWPLFPHCDHDHCIFPPPSICFMLFFGVNDPGFILATSSNSAQSISFIKTSLINQFRSFFSPEYANAKSPFTIFGVKKAEINSRYDQLLLYSSLQLPILTNICVTALFNRRIISASFVSQAFLLYPSTRAQITILCTSSRTHVVLF